MIEEVVKPPELIAKPPLLPLIRPPLVSMHETSVEKLKNGGGGLGKGKTLGVRRSMNGWAARKGGPGGFVPPVIRRP